MNEQDREPADETPADLHPKPELPRKRDADATRGAIIEAAQELFLQFGFSKTSMSQIAKAAGVTKSLIHHHFGSKDALWTAVKQGFFADYFERQKGMLDRSESEPGLLRESIKAYFGYLQHKPDFARMQGWMLLEDDDSCSEMDRELVAKGVQKIVEAQEKGWLRDDVSPDNILVAFLSLVENWFLGRNRFHHHHFLDQPDEERTPDKLDESYLQDMLKIFFSGAHHPDYEE